MRRDVRNDDGVRRPPDEEKIPLLKDFLAKMAVELHEDCIYLRNGQLAVLLYPLHELAR